MTWLVGQGTPFFLAPTCERRSALIQFQVHQNLPPSLPFAGSLSRQDRESVPCQDKILSLVISAVFAKQLHGKAAVIRSGTANLVF